MKIGRIPAARPGAAEGYSDRQTGWRNYSGDALRRHVDFARINTIAITRLPDVCRWAFPAGVREGAEFLIGSLRGEAGRSLKIRLTGTHAGVWKDFSAGYSGRDPVALVAAVQGVSQRQAALALARWLAIDPWRRP